MPTDHPGFIYLQIGFGLLTLISVSLVLLGLKRACILAGKSPESARKAVLMAAGLIFLWMGVLSILALSGFVRDFSSFPPKMGIVPILPLIVISLLVFSRRTRPVLFATPPEWLHYMQAFRIPVEILLWLGFTLVILPVQMTFEGYNFDVISGILGPVVAMLCFSGIRKRKGLAIAYNILGLLLLLNIVVIAVLSMPTPMRQFMNEPANTAVAYFPVIWLPGVLVPLAYALHILSLRKLLGRESRQ